MVGYLFILITIAFTAYGNLVLKWQVNELQAGAGGQLAPVELVTMLMSNVWVWSCFASGFGAFAAWVVALSRFDLAYAYPFMALSFVFVVVGSRFIFAEPLPIDRIVGLSLIVLGLAIAGRS